MDFTTTASSDVRRNSIRTSSTAAPAPVPVPSSSIRLFINTAESVPPSVVSSATSPTFYAINRHSHNQTAGTQHQWTAAAAGPATPSFGLGAVRGRSNPPIILNPNNNLSPSVTFAAAAAASAASRNQLVCHPHFSAPSEFLFDRAVSSGRHPNPTSQSPSSSRSPTTSTSSLVRNLTQTASQNHHRRSLIQTAATIASGELFPSPIRNGDNHPNRRTEMTTTTGVAQTINRSRRGSALTGNFENDLAVSQIMIDELRNNHNNNNNSPASPYTVQSSAAAAAAAVAALETDSLWDSNNGDDDVVNMHDDDVFSVDSSQEEFPFSGEDTDGGVELDVDVNIPGGLMTRRRSSVSNRARRMICTNQAAGERSVGAETGGAITGVNEERRGGDIHDSNNQVNAGEDLILDNGLTGRGRRHVRSTRSDSDRQGSRNESSDNDNAKATTPVHGSSNNNATSLPTRMTRSRAQAAAQAAAFEAAAVALSSSISRRRDSGNTASRTTPRLSETIPSSSRTAPYVPRQCPFRHLSTTPTTNDASTVTTSNLSRAPPSRRTMLRRSARETAAVATEATSSIGTHNPATAAAVSATTTTPLPSRPNTRAYRKRNLNDISSSSGQSSTPRKSGSSSDRKRSASSKSTSPEHESSSSRKKSKTKSKQESKKGGNTKNEEEQSDASKKCCICLDVPKSSELAKLDGCSHPYCFDCIDQWAARENTCPQCKARFTKIERVHKIKSKKKRGKSGEGCTINVKNVKDRDQRSDYRNHNQLQSLFGKLHFYFILARCV